MSTRIEDFLIELSKNPYRTMQFPENPQAESAGLTLDEMSLLISGDTEQLDRTLHMKKRPNEGPTKGVKKPSKKKKK